MILEIVIFLSPNYQNWPRLRSLSLTLYVQGCSTQVCVSLQRRTTFALLRSALATGPIYPRDLVPFKTAPKTVSASRRGPTFFLAFSTAKFYDSKFHRCSLKNEFAPATKGGEVAAKGKTTFEKRTIVLFYLNACMRRTR